LGNIFTYFAVDLVSSDHFHQMATLFNGYHILATDVWCYWEQWNDTGKMAANWPKDTNKICFIISIL